MLKKSPFSRLWYKPDTMFFTPKAYVRIDFNCPESNHSPEASVLTKMFTRLLMDYLNEYGKKILYANVVNVFSIVFSVKKNLPLYYTPKASDNVLQPLSSQKALYI
jgi:Middle or third domain of peptidase_M16